jgi:transcriptional regulator with GAF, ATPase, and Fis domain
VGVGTRSAGHLNWSYRPTCRALPSKSGVRGDPESSGVGSTTLVASLDEMLGTQSGEMDQTSIIRGNPQMGALIRAGRELAGHRPLNELFEVIMDLSMEAVLAGRGVLMTLEGDELRARAARGAGFKISNTVRNRVIKEKSSLLVRDAQMDNALKAQMSIVQQSVRSMIAVPLQTNDRVIGLIYVDSADMIRHLHRARIWACFTVMANSVAAIRIEHARLNEIEVSGARHVKELDQAAHPDGSVALRTAQGEAWISSGSTRPAARWR